MVPEPPPCGGGGLSIPLPIKLTPEVTCVNTWQLWFPSHLVQLCKLGAGPAVEVEAGEQTQFAPQQLSFGLRPPTGPRQLDWSTVLDAAMFAIITCAAVRGWQSPPERGPGVV